jgi:hypothetical protein
MVSTEPGATATDIDCPNDPTRTIREYERERAKPIEARYKSSLAKRAANLFKTASLLSLDALQHSG